MTSLTGRGIGFFRYTLRGQTRALTPALSHRMGEGAPPLRRPQLLSGRIGGCWTWRWSAELQICARLDRRLPDAQHRARTIGSGLRHLYVSTGSPEFR